MEVPKPRQTSGYEVFLLALEWWLVLMVQEVGHIYYGCPEPSVTTTVLENGQEHKYISELEIC
jgi:hypothetical protein